MKRNFHTILVPTDFSDKSLAALEESHNLAKLTGLNITLMHVIRDTGHNIFSLFDPVQSDKLKKEYEDQFRNKMSKIAQDAADRSGVQVNAIISRGKEYDKILKASQLLESRFIVMGVNGEPFEDNKDYIGSNTARIIRKANCPVITINHKHDHDGCRSILLPLDLTHETRQKVTNAIELARLFGSTIKVISINTDPRNKEIESMLRRQLEQVSNFISKNDIRVEAELIEKPAHIKSPAPMIVEYAKDRKDVDLIMIMTQQESGLFELFIGSSAQEIISKAKVPVMSIIPKQLGFISIMS
ncbi:MAG: universal stress protein [Bacteroidales bacterium]